MKEEQERQERAEYNFFKKIEGGLSKLGVTDKEVTRDILLLAFRAGWDAQSLYIQALKLIILKLEQKLSINH